MAAIALVAAACTTSPSPVPSSGPSSGPTPGASGAPSPGATTTVRVYFVLGSFTENGGLVPVERRIPLLEPVGLSAERAAMDALVAGPNAAELGARPAMFTLLPEGTRFLGLELADGVATVDLSGAFESGGGSASAKGRLAQVAYTLTQFPTIRAVRFRIDGTLVTVFSDARLPLDQPVDRMTYTDQLPAIFIDEPAWGGTLGQPAHLAGLANAFEATFQVRILDAGRRSLADGPAMATCGTGCWGTWDLTVPYSVAAAGPGTLQAYELSAADGSVVNLAEYPVTLTP